ncbi:unnamed protein product [Cylicocyclus nassatus]|uniref:Uncharacterized protein n=1 Tax=Cylicocyclus nassatus TaxID=53992 RepID=A0AA36M3N4_CYLNA|nr:unnamed protein product [Cylicocyclus nassatus]
MPTTSTYPYPTPAESNPRQLFNASHLLCIVAITMMSLTALASAQSYQAPPTTTTQTPRPRLTQKPLPITLPERPRTAPSFSTRIPPTQAPSQSFHRVPPRPLATPSTRLPIRPPNLPVQTATLQIQTLQRPLPSSPKSTTTVSPNLSKKAREVDSYYRETYNNICNRQYLNTLRIRTFSTVEPTWAARELLQRNDVVATLQDSELFVTRCRPVHPQKIFEDHRVNDTCYVLTPVQADDAIWFAVPGTQDLLPISATTPCPYLPQRRSHHLQYVLPPNNLQPAHLFLFNPPSVYSQSHGYFTPFARFYLQPFVVLERNSSSHRSGPMQHSNTPSPSRAQTGGAGGQIKDDAGAT